MAAPDEPLPELEDIDEDEDGFDEESDDETDQDDRSYFRDVMGRDD